MLLFLLLLLVYNNVKKTLRFLCVVGERERERKMRRKEKHQSKKKKIRFLFRETN